MLKSTVFLTQTDTSIGFVSQDAKRLDFIKKRPSDKQYIKAVDSLETLKDFSRVPSIHKNRVRRSQKTTFVMPNHRSYRVIKERQHLYLLSRLKWAYTTSANLSTQPYDEVFARKVADVIIEPLKQNNKASHIYKLGKKSLRRLR
jgi:tRNA A37 threonylcarbamoyladenosine synthetase subunit TsaC/SUA5/YrdC